MKIPSKQQLATVITKRLDDLIIPNLKLLFCGINPGLYSAYTGYNFARPGNRFWKALHMSGFTKRLLQASEQRELLDMGYGITNLVDRPSSSAAELSIDEYIEGGRELRRKLLKFKPVWVAFVGVDAYRKAFGKPKAIIGNQHEKLEEVNVWVLPSPSGLNAHYSLEDLAALFGELRRNIET